MWEATKDRIMDESMSKLLIFKPRWGHLGGDSDLIRILHAGRERNAKAKRERDKKESKNRLRVVNKERKQRSGGRPGPRSKYVVEI